MTCSRCQGLMVRIELEDAESTAAPDPIVGWRCLLCGEIVDPVIQAHRGGRQASTRDRARRRFAVSLAGGGSLRRKATEGN